MVIDKYLFWCTSWDPVGFKDFVDFDIMVVACPLQNCCYISCGDYNAVHFSIMLYTGNIVIMVIFSGQLVTVSYNSKASKHFCEASTSFGLFLLKQSIF
jgi:hypothetical protein